MLDIIVRGGPVMIPLLLCSVVAVAVALERLFTLWRGCVDTEDLMDDIKLSLQQGKVLEAMQITKKTRGPVASVLAAGIAYYDRDKEEIKERLQEIAREELFKMERRMPILDSIVAIAPLLGLLGTVTGIIKTFRVLAAFEQLGDPTTIGAGIAEALITTAFGLVIAIPTLLVYSYINSLIDRNVSEINKRSTELVDFLESRSDLWSTTPD